MPNENPVTLETGLRQTRHKLTRPRLAILDILAEADEHLTPAQVHRKARNRYPRLSLATVYRTLDLLTELGYVQRVHFEGGCHSYVPTVRPHAHQLVCTECGRALEFADCDLAPLIVSLENKTGFQIRLHVLELMGRCPACQARGRTGHERRA